MFWSCPLSANTQEYYAKEDQTSFDPVVFFKLMLIGYLENIPSDSKIVEQAGMRLDMLYFFYYNIDEPLPWHSTLSRTRKLYDEELFLKVFNHILELCIKTGMVDGRTQAIDSTLIKANVSMVSLRVNLKITGQEYYNKLKNKSEEDNKKYPPPKSKYPNRQENEKRVSRTNLRLLNPDVR